MKTFKEIYKLPFKVYEGHNWVYDQEGDFCFQFETYDSNVYLKLLAVINGEEVLENKNLTFKHENGYIKTNLNQDMILIRGWGNLTSPSCHNLSPEEASNVQDTLAEYIVEILNKR